MLLAALSLVAVLRELLAILVLAHLLASLLDDASHRTLSSRGASTDDETGPAAPLTQYPRA